MPTSGLIGVLVPGGLEAIVLQFLGSVQMEPVCSRAGSVTLMALFLTAWVTPSSGCSDFTMLTSTMRASKATIIDFCIAFVLKN